MLMRPLSTVPGAAREDRWSRVPHPKVLLPHRRGRRSGQPTPKAIAIRISRSWPPVNSAEHRLRGRLLRREPGQVDRRLAGLAVPVHGHDVGQATACWRGSWKPVTVGSGKYSTTVKGAIDTGRRGSAIGPRSFSRCRMRASRIRSLYSTRPATTAHDGSRRAGPDPPGRQPVASSRRGAGPVQGADPRCADPAPGEGPRVDGAPQAARLDRAVHRHRVLPGPHGHRFPRPAAACRGVGLRGSGRR